ncbi:hypothetical protein ACXM0N_04845 [Peribacillus simplex]
MNREQLIEMYSEALERKKEGVFLSVLLLGILINDEMRELF